MSMTRDEAIKWLEETIQDTDTYWESCSEALQKELDEQKEVFDLALTALRPITREQVAEVWKGCDLCLDDSWQRSLMIPKRFDHTNMLSAELAQFCPGCGRPLTDEAVDMVMERLEALKDGKS